MVDALDELAHGQLAQQLFRHMDRGQGRIEVARKGDIVIFTFDTIHQSQPNLSHGYRPLLLFEIEPYEGFPSDEHGNPPVIINGELSPGERLICRLHGIPKKIKLAIGKVPIFKKWYRQLKYG